MKIGGIDLSNVRNFVNQSFPDAMERLDDLGQAANKTFANAVNTTASPQQQELELRTVINQSRSKIQTTTKMMIDLTNNVEVIRDRSGIESASNFAKRYANLERDLKAAVLQHDSSTISLKELLEEPLPTNIKELVAQIASEDIPSNIATYAKDPEPVTTLLMKRAAQIAGTEPPRRPILHPDAVGTAQTTVPKIELPPPSNSPVLETSTTSIPKASTTPTTLPTSKPSSETTSLLPKPSTPKPKSILEMTPAERAERLQEINAVKAEYNSNPWY